jgi:hypothetical protein
MMALLSVAEHIIKIRNQNESLGSPASQGHTDVCPHPKSDIRHGPGPDRHPPEAFVLCFISSAIVLERLRQPSK